MDYRIFNVRMSSFLCVRIHTGVGHIDSTSAQHFLLGKTLTNLMGFKPLVMESIGSWSGTDALPIEPARHPNFCLTILIFSYWQLHTSSAHHSLLVLYHLNWNCHCQTSSEENLLWTKTLWKLPSILLPSILVWDTGKKLFSVNSHLTSKKTIFAIHSNQPIEQDIWYCVVTCCEWPSDCTCWR